MDMKCVALINNWRTTTLSILSAMSLKRKLLRSTVVLLIPKQAQTFSARYAGTTHQQQRILFSIPASAMVLCDTSITNV
jgi:hypothetical protein